MTLTQILFALHMNFTIIANKKQELPMVAMIFSNSGGCLIEVTACASLTVHTCVIRVILS
jgi:hypothetical protein